MLDDLIHPDELAECFGGKAPVQKPDGNPVLLGDSIGELANAPVSPCSMTQQVQNTSNLACGSSADPSSPSGGHTEADSGRRRGRLRPLAKPRKAVQALAVIGGGGPRRRLRAAGEVQEDDCGLRATTQRAAAAAEETNMATWRKRRKT